MLVNMCSLQNSPNGLMGKKMSDLAAFGDQPGLKNTILEMTRSAISEINNPHFYHTERGFQGQLLIEMNILPQMEYFHSRRFFLEIEPQKNRTVHSTRQRPDMVLHIPRDITGSPVDENNLAVWGLKRRATIDRAIQDFRKLDEMFEFLHYPVGVFINIDSRNHFLDCYRGAYQDRIIGIAVELQHGVVSLNRAVYINDVLTSI
jgi:hypothetical protein